MKKNILRFLNYSEEVSSVRKGWHEKGFLPCFVMRRKFCHVCTEVSKFLQFPFRIVYDRVPYHRTLAVFALSAFWHGFYPGYYMAFFTCGLMVEAARKVHTLS